MASFFSAAPDTLVLIEDPIDSSIVSINSCVEGQCKLRGMDEVRGSRMIEVMGPEELRKHSPPTQLHVGMRYRCTCVSSLTNITTMKA
jgi:hypothetical protein